MANIGSLMSLRTKVKLATASTIVLSQSEFDLDWTTYNIFKKNLTATSAFTFSQTVDSVSIVLVLINNTESDIAVSFPSGVKWPGSITSSVAASTSAVVTFIKVDGVVYCSALTGMV